MAKETQREKIERLEKELEQVTKQRDETFQEVSALRKQINAAVEDTDIYKSLAKELQEEQLRVKVAQHSRELTEKMNRELQNANAEIKDRYDALATAYDALKSDFDALNEQLKAKEAEKSRNERGAGRKAALSDEQCAKAVRMHELGLSYREIGKELGVSFSVIARACQKSAAQK